MALPPTPLLLDFSFFFSRNAIVRIRMNWIGNLPIIDFYARVSGISDSNRKKNNKPKKKSGRERTNRERDIEMNEIKTSENCNQQCTSINKERQAAILSNAS